jgi:uncharacterized membrane protein SirB2
MPHALLIISGIMIVGIPAVLMYPSGGLWLVSAQLVVCLIVLGPPLAILLILWKIVNSLGRSISRFSTVLAIVVIAQLLPLDRP